MAGRVHPQLVLLVDHFAGEWIHLQNPFHLIAPVLDAIHRLLIRWKDLECVALHPKLASYEVDLVSLVLDIDEAPNGLIERELHTTNETEELTLVLLW